MKRFLRKRKPFVYCAILGLFFAASVFGGYYALSSGSLEHEEAGQTCTEAEEKNARCWEAMLVQVVNEEGLEAAFETLSTLYESEPAFAKECHGYTHIIGRETYKLFAQKRALDLPPEAQHCAFGFYHGFMETMLHTTGDKKEAQAFCSYAEELRGGDAKGACYHGIGHGFLDGNDPRIWGDPHELLAEPLALCEEIGETEYFIDRCASGVFNSLGIFFNNPFHERLNVNISKEDPYALCREQEKWYFRKSCFEELDTTVLRLYEGDLAGSLKVVEKIENDSDAQFAAEALVAFTFFRGISFDHEEAAALCRGLQARLHNACIRGFGAGAVEFGAPGKEYQAGLDFCQSPTLGDAERSACMERLVPYLKTLYSPEYFERICKEAVLEDLRARYCVTSDVSES